MIYSFDEVEGLFFLNNPAVDTPPVDGSGYITSVPCSPLVVEEGSLGKDLLPSVNTPAQAVQFGAGININQLPAYAPTAVESCFDAGGRFDYDLDGGVTVVIVIEVATNDNLGRCYQVRDTNSSGDYLGLVELANTWRPRANNTVGSSDNELPITINAPLVIVQRYLPSTGVATFTISTDGGAPTSAVPMSKVSTVKAGHLGLFDSVTSSLEPFQGKVGLFAMYSRYVTDDEVTDLIDLTNTWVETGAAPTLPVQPKDGKFYANTNDELNTNIALHWEWAPKPPDDQTPPVWADAITSLSDASYENTNGQDNDTLNINSAVLADAGIVQCVATVDYMAEPVDSAIAALNVVAAPTTTWQYEALGDTGNWQDATVLSGVSNSTGPTLEIASTVNGESGTVRASTTNSEGTATGTAVLVVEDEVVIPPGASGSMSCTAKHPYAQFQWFGKKTTGTEWEPVEDVWPGKTTVSTVDNVSTISWAGVVDSDAGQAFCRIGNPLYVVATGPVTPGDGDGYSYVDSDIASISVGALEFTLQPQDVTVEETALPGTLSPKLNGRPPLDNTRHLQHCAELCRR